MQVPRELKEEFNRALTACRQASKEANSEIREKSGKSMRTNLLLLGNVIFNHSSKAKKHFEFRYGEWVWVNYYFRGDAVCHDTEPDAMTIDPAADWKASEETLRSEMAFLNSMTKERWIKLHHSSVAIPINPPLEFVEQHKAW